MWGLLAKTGLLGVIIALFMFTGNYISVVLVVLLVGRRLCGGHDLVRFLFFSWASVIFMDLISGVCFCYTCLRVPWCAYVA